jgi:hypothetical protein
MSTAVGAKQRRGRSTAARKARVVKRQTRLERMRSEFRAARQRRLIERGITLWKQTEAAQLAVDAHKIPGGNDESE